MGFDHLNFPKDVFLQKLRRNPELLNYLTSCDPEFTVQVMLQYPSSKLQASLMTIETIRAYIKELLTSHQSYYSGSGLRDFPIEVRMQMTEEEVRSICARHPNAIRHCVNVPYDIILAAVNDGDICYKDIPTEHQTDEIKIICLIKGLQIPMDVLNESLVKEALEHKPEILLRIPELFWTTDRMKKLFQSNPTAILTSSPPEELWDEELVDLVLSVPHNFEYIPAKFYTKERYLRVLNANVSMLNRIPKEYLTEDLYLNALTKGHFSKFYEGGIHPELFTDEFVLKLASLDNTHNSCQGISNVKLRRTISEELWLQIITANPKAIEFFRKEEQTPAMVNAFLQGATPEQLDRYDDLINLRLIKRDQAPLLVGTQSERLQNFATKKLKSTQRMSKSEKAEELSKSMDASSCVKVNLSDEKYLRLLGKL